MDFKDIKEALILTAHCDDETIFAGGTMLTYPEIEWKVICVGYGGNDVRHKEFENAIEMYRKCGVNILGDCHSASDWPLPVLGLDIMLTHNSEGDYGHEEHKSVNGWARKHHRNIWEFICPGSHKIAPQPFKEKVCVVPLTKEILAKKTEIFNTCYKSQLETWRARPDVMQWAFWTGPEIFTSDA